MRTRRALAMPITAVGDIARLVLPVRSRISPYTFTINPPMRDPMALMAAKPTAAVLGDRNSSESAQNGALNE
jgi:hypothetical protein